MKISCDIDRLIEFLQKKKENGYRTVELIDDMREEGWYSDNPIINFITCKQEPTVLGIDVRTKNK